MNPSQTLEFAKAAPRAADRAEWPESEDSASELAYDPEQPESVMRARELLRARLGLAYLPILCSEVQRPKRLFVRIGRRIARLFRGRR